MVNASHTLRTRSSVFHFAAMGPAYLSSLFLSAISGLPLTLALSQESGFPETVWMTFLRTSRDASGRLLLLYILYIAPTFPIIPNSVAMLLFWLMYVFAFSILSGILA